MATITHHNVSYADGVKNIHYLAAGPEDGPLIFFIHGWPATAITWKLQLQAFASVGFRAIAPDMPGYGQSTARREVNDYSQEAIVEGMMALLADTGRKAAVWVGHDWGSGVTSSVAIQHPETVEALVSICVPYLTVELGWDAFLPLVNRTIYPEDQYPYGQWDYMKNYEENFEKAVAWFDLDAAGMSKAFAMKPRSRPDVNEPSPLATVRKTGPLNGLPRPPSVDQSGPSVLPDDVVESFMSDMQKTGFWAGCAYYLHHKRNAEYHASRDKKLKQPVLFVHAIYDTACETKNSRLMEPMREACSNLTEVTMDSAHFVPFEKPYELNSALFKFLSNELPGKWPGAEEIQYTKNKL